jgi:hypothetical protein
MVTTCRRDLQRQNPLMTTIIIIPPHVVSRLSRKREIFDVSQPYLPPRPLTGIAFLFILLLRGIFDVSQTYMPPRPVTEIALLYGDGV